ASAPAGVAVTRAGALRVARDGEMRWLVVPLAPEALWPKLEQFWKDRGTPLTTDDPKAGVMETDWVQNKDKRPADFIQSTLGKLLPNLFDSGFRDRYRTRVERTATGSDVYVTHRGLEDMSSANEQGQTTGWRATPPDPQAEAAILAQMLVALGSTDEQARIAVASAPQAPAKAQIAAADAPTSIVVDDGFDRAWRRVGIVLDRGGFTVEDRDRAAGIYYVRWVDPRNAGKEGPGWWARLWGDHSDPQAALRYRLVLKGRDDKSTLLTVQNSAGVTDTGANAKRIVALLVQELR
ncbi:MAG: outer membrane protein assembly factor BamC, partial [Burkholderiales bacterium]|nr:outer membrane protein assembly factor BamC [Burkholderiales bacterium]